MFHVYSRNSNGSFSHRFSGTRHACNKWMERDGHGWNFVTQINHPDKVAARYRD